MIKRLGLLSDEDLAAALAPRRPPIRQTTRGTSAAAAESAWHEFHGLGEDDSMFGAPSPIQTDGPAQPSTDSTKAANDSPAADSFKRDSQVSFADQSAAKATRKSSSESGTAVLIDLQKRNGPFRKLRAGWRLVPKRFLRLLLACWALYMALQVL